MKKGIKKNVVILFLITAIIVPIHIKADYVKDPDHVLIKGMLELYKTNNIVNTEFDNLIIVDTPRDEYTPFNLSLNRYGSTPKIVRNQKDLYNPSNYFVLDEINTTSYLFKYNNPNMDNLLKYVDNKINNTFPNYSYRNLPIEKIINKFLYSTVNGVQYYDTIVRQEIFEKVNMPDTIVKHKKATCYHVSLLTAIALNKMDIPAIPVNVVTIKNNNTSNYINPEHMATLFYDKETKQWKIIDPYVEERDITKNQTKLFYNTLYKNIYTISEYKKERKSIPVLSNYFPMEKNTTPKEDLKYLLEYYNLI